MDQKLFSQVLFSLFLAVSTIQPSTSQHEICTNTVRAGYWLSQSDHYSPLSNITSSLYTHLYYYSLSLDETTSLVALPLQDQLPLLSTFSATLKSTNPSLKTLLSIATSDDQGSNTSGAAFSTMAADPNLRSAFINSTIKLAVDHTFDGLDLAWQFPSSSADMANLAILIAEWRTRVIADAENSSSPFLLTATVYFADHLFEGPDNNLDYPIEAISKNLDWINTLSFGFHKNSAVTAFDAALYDKTTHFSASYGLSSWIDAGIPPCKLVMGIPLYGRSWYLKNKVKNELGAQVVAEGPREKLSNQTGLLSYIEIEELLKETNTSFIYDNQSVSSYLHSGGLWVSFDSPEVVEEKIKFSLRNGLLGYLLSPISFDYSNYTVSKQALDVWQRYNASGEEKDSYEKAQSPGELNLQDGAPNASADSSGSIQDSSPMLQTFLLHSFLPLFLSLCLTTI